MLKVVFIGSVEFSARLLEALYHQSNVEVVGVVTKFASRFNSDFFDLVPIAAKHKTPVYFWQSNNEAFEEFVASCAPDVIFCFGWSHLLPSSICRIPPKGAIGYHPAALPQNRGRHPIIWALVLGLPETASTFFFLEDEADSGRLVDQVTVPITKDDYAKDLYERLSEVAVNQLPSVIERLSDGETVFEAQPQEGANTWRKRGAKDGLIDFRMAAETVYNLIRGLSHPYVGAHLALSDNESIKVWRATIAHEPVELNHEPGKVLAINGNACLVKCGIGAIWLTEHEISTLPEPGSYLS